MSFTFPASSVPLFRGSHVQAHSVSASRCNTNKLSLIDRAGDDSGFIGVSEEGTSVGTFRRLNFVGPTVTATDEGDGTARITVAAATTPTLAEVLTESNDAGDLAIINVSDLNFDVSGATHGIQLGTSVADAVASGATGIAIGGAAAATGDYGVALGQAATATGTDAIALGYNSEANEEGIAIGRDTYADLRDVIIGTSATRVGGLGSFTNAAVGIGHNATTAPRSVVIGTGASAHVSGFAVVVGTGASTTGSNGVALGVNSTAAQGAVAVGSADTTGPEAAATCSIVISSGFGDDISAGYVTSGATGAIVIGSTNTTANRPYAKGAYAVSIGGGGSTLAGARTTATASIAIGYGALAGATNAVAIGREAYSSYQNSVSVGTSVATRVSDEVAVRGVRHIRREFTAQTATVTLLDFPLLDGETVAVDAFVCERVTAATADENKTRLYAFRDYHASRTSTTVTLNAGSSTTSSDAGWTAVAATVAISASTTNVRIAVTSVPNTDARTWSLALTVYGGSL